MRKRNILVVVGLAFAMLMGGCTEFNEQFEGLEDLTKPTNKAKYSYTLTEADYTTIGNRALAAAKNAVDSAKARSISTNKYFTETVPAADYVPFLLRTSFPYGDLGSTAMVTYVQGQDKPAFLGELGTVNILAAADYQVAWGSSTAYVNAFTPTVSATSKISDVLKAKFPNATNGQYKFVEYNYSAQEASAQVTEVTYLAENWNSHSYLPSPYAPVSENGWMSKDVLASANWLIRAFSGNQYPQASSNNSGAINQIWLISPEINLANAIAPNLTFDVNVGYWNANCLTVWISEDFNGTEAGITTANWTNISSNFTFPEVPTGAYGVLASAGDADLTAYANKKVRIAFRYDGDGRSALDRGTDPLRTTTYQIDNFKLSEEKVALTVASSVKQYAAYKYNGSTWVAAEPSFVALQPADYTAMGLSFISSAQAPLYIPNFLRNKFPYAQEGEMKTVIYKSGSNQTFSAAVQYQFVGGNWITEDYKEGRTEQFVFSNNGWIFDPTVNHTMVAADYLLMVNYILDYPDPAISIFAHPFYKNEEYYYGFSSRYSNVNFRLSYRNPYFTGEWIQPASIDPELSGKATDAEKVALLYERLKEGMKIFAQLRYPNAVPTVSGVEVYYNLTTYVYYVTGVAAGNQYRMYTFKCTAAAAGDTPPQFEFIEDKVVE